MAALDGIQNQIDPGPPLDKDLYDLQPEELGEVPRLPGSLTEALAALRDDHEFLLRGDVFTEDVIDTWTWYKTEHEVDAIRQRLARGGRTRTGIIVAHRISTIMSCDTILFLERVRTASYFWLRLRLQLQLRLGFELVHVAPTE